MYKFMALVWNEEVALASQAADYIRTTLKMDDVSWKAALETSGLIVLHRGDIMTRMQSIKLGNDGGVILGKMFKTSQEGDHSSINNDIEGTEERKITLSCGKHLITDYWGRYIAFLQDQNTRQISILKSPVEGFYCYYAEYHGITVYFSCLEDVKQLGLVDFSINWPHIASHLKYFKMDKIDTAFQEIYKLQPGECRQHSQGQVASSMYWNPVKIAQDNIIEDLGEAAGLLRKTVVGSVAAWADSYDRIIHKLSGGLDSSIVLACLMQSRPPNDITCLNYYPSSDKSGDERYFARQVARDYGVELIEKELDASNVRLEGLFDISPLPTPELYMNAVDRCGYEASLAEEVGAEVLFAGEGGDGIFFQPRSHFLTSDYLQTHGPNLGLLPIALNNARLMKKSLWWILYHAVKDRLFNLNDVELMADSHQVSRLLNADAMQAIKYEDTFNPLIMRDKHLTNGKRLHISMCELPNIYCYSAKPSDFLESCYPLLSQPIIECVLRFPSYILTTGARDRGLARMAFKNDLPTQVLKRESKGGIQNYAAEIVEGNISFIREVLLDGILVKEKLLNRAALEQALGERHAVINAETVNILRHVCTEVWFRKTMN